MSHKSWKFTRGGLLAAVILVTRYSGPVPSVKAADSKTIYLDYGHPIPTLYSGPDALVQGMASSTSLALSLVSDDFDHDGVLDLAVGYMTPAGPAVELQRGNLDAFAPQGRASFEAIARNQFPSPLLTSGRVIAVPNRPDFMASGVFRIEGNTDLILAARGGSAIDVLRGDGKGSFQAGQTIIAPGPISALAASRIDASAHYSQVFVGVRTPTGPQLLVYTGSPDGLALVQTLALSADATDFKFGDLDGDSFSDVLILSGGTVSILHGREFQSAGQIERLDVIPVKFEVSGAALGTFIHSPDANLQMALLARDGTVHLLTQEGLKPSLPSGATTRNAAQIQSKGGQPDWREVESFPGVAPFDAATPPLILRTRISSNNGDDVMILNAAGGQLAVITHPNRTTTDTADSIPAGVVLTRPDSSFGASAALQMRVNIDGRPGVVFIKPQPGSPFSMMPLPDPVFSVNTTNDTVDANVNDGNCSDANGQCSLRAAIMQANHDTGNDTILVPAGTYTLTLTGPNKEIAGETDAYGSLDIFNGVSIVGEVDGAGNPATIIAAGTNNGNGIDKVFAVNPNSASAFDTSFSNLQIQFGRNPGSFSGGLILPHGSGGGLSWQGNLTGNMSLTNCVITDNSTVDGDGGGIAIDSGGKLHGFSGTGVFTISNSIIQRNSANEFSTGKAGNGGGISVSLGTALLVTNSQIINNNATQVAGTGGMGGGIYFSTPGNAHTQAEISGSTIAGNQSSGHGAGIYTAQGIRIDQGTVITGNSGADQGGGIWTTSNGQITTLSRVSVTGNSATSQGGGIFSGSPASSNQFFMTFSRIAGNSATLGSNLSSSAGEIDATLNWWGTNSPATTISGSVNFDPFIVLSNTASPAKVRINQSTTITGSFLQDDLGEPIAANDLNELIGLNITFNNAVLGTVQGIQPETIQSSGNATVQFTAGSTGGMGHVDATVDGAIVTANIAILQAPTINQSFNPTSVKVNAPSTISFTINSVNVVAINSSFNDSLPTGLVVAPNPNLVNNCGGTVSASPGSSSINFADAALAPGNCTITVDVTSATDGAYTNAVTLNSTDAGPGNTSSANLIVINPPAITKSFGAASIPVNIPLGLLFTITNTNVNSNLNGIAFNDALPTGMVVATPVTVNNTCGGTATGIGGSGLVSLSGASLAHGGSCTVSINVIGTIAGPQNNTVSASSTNGGAGSNSTASVLVIAPPAIQESFDAAFISLGGTTNLSITISNPNTSTPLDGIGFSDTLPGGLVISTPNGLTGSCGGTLTATAGTNLIVLSGAILSPMASCTFSVSLSGTVAGSQVNAIGGATSLEAGTGVGTSASITVLAPPSISASFVPASINLNATTSLSFTIKNPAANPVALAGVAFTDALPAGLAVTNGVSGICGGTLTVSGGNSIALDGATIGTNTNCVFSIGVTGNQIGQFSTTTNSVTSTNAGAGNTASASLSVAVPPSISQGFAVPTVALNQATLLTFSIANPSANTFPLTGISFADSLPAGLVVGTSGVASSNCGGVVTAVAGSSSIALAGGTLAAGGSCTIVVSVQGTTSGTKVNGTGPISSNESGVGPTGNTATLTVVGGPNVSAAFGASSIPQNGTTSLTLAIANPNPGTNLTKIGIVDTLPGGLVIASGVTGTCLTGGAGVQTAGSATGGPGGASISLAGLALAGGGSCSLSVNITGVNAGLQVDTSGNVTASFDAGGGQFAAITGGSASANLVVVAPPAISQAFGAPRIVVAASTTLMVTIANPRGNTVPLNGVGFIDSLPSGLVISAANGLSNTCGGSVTAQPGTGALSLTGGTIAAGSSCALTVNVTGAVVGNYTVTTSAVVSANGGAGNTAAANVAVGNAPAASITAYSGASQTVVDAGGANPFQALVTDANGFTVAGATVAFAAAGGGTFLGNGLSAVGSQAATAITNSEGIATSPMFVVSGAAGTFQVTASVAGVAQVASFVVTVIHTNLNIAPSVLVFSYNSGDSNLPAPQTININQDTPFAIAVGVSPSSGWLTAALGTTTATSASVVVSANPAGMAPGSYSGSIILDFGSSKVTVFAGLTVVGQPTLVSSLASLSFAAVSGQGSPTSQTLSLSALSQDVGFTVTTSAPWILATSTGSMTPASVTVTVDPTSAIAQGLSAAGGTISGSVQITAQGAANSPLSIPVVLNLTSGLAIAPGGFANAASWKQGPGAPNTILALAGNFTCGSAPGVMVSGQQAEVIGATAGLITFTLPGSVDGQGAVPVAVNCGGQQSDSINIPIAADAPGIFTLSMTGTGQGAVLNPDLSVNGPSNPAAVNSYLAVYGTGFGGYGPAGTDGLQRLIYDVQAFVGNNQAHVEFAGHAPESTLGLQQINVLIPPGAPTGPAVPIRLVINGVSTQDGVTVAIR